MSLKQCGIRGEINLDFTEWAFTAMQGIGGGKLPSFAHKANYLEDRRYEHYKYERHNYGSSLFFTLLGKRKKSKGKAYGAH